MSDIAAIEARIGSDYQPMGVAKAFVTAARDATDLLVALRAAEAREARLREALCRIADWTCSEPHMGGERFRMLGPATTWRVNRAANDALDALAPTEPEAER